MSHIRIKTTHYTLLEFVSLSSSYTSDLPFTITFSCCEPLENSLWPMEVPYFLSSHLKFHSVWRYVRYLLTGLVLFHHLIYLDCLWFTCFPSQVLSSLGKEARKGMNLAACDPFPALQSSHCGSPSRSPLSVLGHSFPQTLSTLVACSSDSLMKGTNFSIPRLAKMEAWLERLTWVPVHPLRFLLSLTASSLSCSPYFSSIFCPGHLTCGLQAPAPYRYNSLM